MSPLQDSVAGFCGGKDFLKAVCCDLREKYQEKLPIRGSGPKSSKIHQNLSRFAVAIYPSSGFFKLKKNDHGHHGHPAGVVTSASSSWSQAFENFYVGRCPNDLVRQLRAKVW